jgi:hypothetical protein
MSRQKINYEKNQILEEKIGECLGLEIGVQKTVSEIDSKGLLSNPVIKKQLIGLQEVDKNHEDKMQKLACAVIKSVSFDSKTMENKTQESLSKIREMTHIYLGENFDLQTALEFLCLTKEEEIIHYEMLSSLASKARDKNFGPEIRRILNEEKNNLKLCMSLAKQNVKE